MPTESSIWQRVAMKHDVRRMSRDGLRDLAYDLYAAGAIGSSDYRLLLLDPVTYASDWPGWSVLETPEESDGRRDWIREIQARIARGSADSGYVAYQQSLLALLQRVEAAHPATEPAVETPMQSAEPSTHGAYCVGYRSAWRWTASR
ncbi:MAG TPA: hypothetical protein VN893_16140 [Bryobacteraceae bacterium]|nr:hypothetical protein [Bryobacteraceae bacterium]